MTDKSARIGVGVRVGPMEFKLLAACRWLAAATQVRVTSRAARVLPVERIAHLDDDEHRQRARLGLGGDEHVTVDAREHARLGRALHVMRLTVSQQVPGTSLTRNSRVSRVQGRRTPHSGKRWPRPCTSGPELCLFLYSPLWVGDQPPISDTVRHTSLFTQLSDDPSTINYS